MNNTDEIKMYCKSSAAVPIHKKQTFSAVSPVRAQKMLY